MHTVDYALFDRCKFDSNQAGLTQYQGGTGGAIVFFGVKILARAVNCTFTNNWAEHEGGAVTIGNTCSLNLKDCHFEGNVAEAFGGAVKQSVSGLDDDVCLSDSDVAKD